MIETTPKQDVVRTEKRSRTNYVEEIVKKSMLRNKESPRAAVILVVAYVDNLLTRLLCLNLIVPDSDDERLFSEQGPLYNFGAKIMLARRMGIISTDMDWLLTKLRKLRDLCAHSDDELTFESNAVRDRIISMHERLTDNHKGTSPGEMLEDIGNGVAICLHAQIEDMSPLSDASRKEPLFR